MDKKDVKALRTKELSQMSVQELKDYVKKAEGKGFSISKSKDLGKAVDLIKVQEPKGYSQKQVESAKTSLQTKSEIPTLQRLGIAIPDWKKQQAGMAVTGGETTSPTMSDGGITGIGSSMKTDASGIPTYQDSSELKAVEAEYDKKKLEADKAANIIDDNPFFSEATRLGRQGKLNEQKARDLGTLQEKITYLKAEEQLRYNVAMDRYKLQQDQVKQNVDKLKMYIDSGAILNATAKDLAQIGVATGMSQSMLQGIISRTRADIAAKNAPSMGVEFVTNEQTGEVQVVSYNKSTGQITGTNSLGQLKGAKILTEYEKDVESGRDRLRKGEPWGNVWNTIYNKYKTNSILGTPQEIGNALNSDLGGADVNKPLSEEFGWNKGGAYEQYIKTQTNTKPSSGSIVFPQNYTLPSSSIPKKGE